MQDQKGNGLLTTDKRWLLAAALCLTIFFTLFPNFHPEALMGMHYHWWLDMLFHGGYYFVVCSLLYAACHQRTGTAGFFLLALTLSFIFEAAQSWIPGRSVSFLDLASNTIGIGLATTMGYWRLARKPSAEEERPPGK